MREARHAYSKRGRRRRSHRNNKNSRVEIIQIYARSLVPVPGGDERSDSIPGNKFHALFRTRRNAPQSMEPILWKKSFLISRRVPIMHMHRPLTSPPSLPPPRSLPPFRFHPRVKAVFSAFKPNDSSNSNNKSGGGEGDLSVSVPRECAPRTLSLEFRNLFSTSVFIIVGSFQGDQPTEYKSC